MAVTIEQLNADIEVAKKTLLDLNAHKVQLESNPPTPPAGSDQGLRPPAANELSSND